MLLQPNSRLLFIGDSITDCGRKRPIGEGAFDQALGNGYVSLIDAALAAVYPDFAIRIINMGVSGETVQDLKSRWTSDVLNLKPDWLSILIGINDVWQLISQPWQTDIGASIDEYAATLDDLVLQVRSNVHGQILMTPYFLEPNLQEPMREMMDRYGGVVAQIAKNHNGILVNTQKRFDSVLKSIDPMQLAMDRVHLNLAGHMILAREFLRNVGFSWDRSV